ncbi:hypothetical protein [Kordiimonas sp. SCSIO 12610]|uniref:hypothetical protein n=1 Tax=Kordiimonas sp. SCSIO 12610 TaxID=2829597 RepID=UPI00210D3CAD|nr:hypothetical protein [Kordiimonas sp. SCSIO 12610]UTW55570.1 hypothetical protein KFF44_01355 [Kordiimonas sp. SCSIO 12610]
MPYTASRMNTVPTRSIIAGAFILILSACSNTATNVNPSAANTSAASNTADNAQTNAEDTPIINNVVTQPIIEESSALPDINTLAGLNPREIENLMGIPDLKREDGNIQVFLYESSTCVLEVILRENSDGNLKSESLKTRDRQGNPADKTSCLTSLLPDGWQN